MSRCDEENPTKRMFKTDEVRKADEFSVFLGDVIKINNGFVKTETYLGYQKDREHQALPPMQRGMVERSEQVRYVVREILRRFDMDPNLVGKRPLTKEDGNWLEELHDKICGISPECFLKIYRNETPTLTEYALMTRKVEQNFMSRIMGEHYIRQMALIPWRSRGNMVRHMEHVVDLKEMIEQCSSFAIPSDEVLSKIAAHAPLVEVGAGTGYWSALLQQRGVDIVPYDGEPPTHAQNNKYFDMTYTNVLKGTGSAMFKGEEGAKLAKKALLIVWPNKPDYLDNPTISTPEENLETKEYMPIWDIDCLKSYMEAGGDTVIYVGEREENIMPAGDFEHESGLSASRCFQEHVWSHFSLEDTLECPRWWCHADDVTIWKRNPVY